MNYSIRLLKIVGCGGHGRVVADIAKVIGDSFGGFLDDNYASAPPHLLVEGPIREVLPRLVNTYGFALGIDDAGSRRQWAELILAARGDLITLIHPSAVIAPDVIIDDGSVVMAGAIVNTGTHIGRWAIINTGAILDHDNVIEENVQVAPGCRLAGNVTCKRDSFIGIGATIIPHITIGEGAYVAAGATVITHVSPHTLVAGCPAVKIRDI
jgi:sugar O-acyltransferase (sialic acid O-acetyltransferase NeuD family)